MTGLRLRVDLDRVAANFATLRARSAPADVMVVVKDDAYGHGVEAIVGALGEVAWIGSFDVATGIRARRLAPAARVFTWAVEEAAEISAAIEADLDLGVGDAGYLEEVAAVSGGRGIRVHLKIDTGLHRNGVRPEDWAPFVARAAELEAAGDIAVTGIWSHIAEASDDDDDRARGEFTRAVAAARAAGLSPEVRHLAASAAGHARPEFRLDLVRFGAFVYGVRSADGHDVDGIRPAATLLAPVTSVTADTVEIGAGSLDGLLSSLGGRVSVGTPHGARALMSVGLGTSTVDGWPGAAVGDDVAIFGPGDSGESSATTLAEAVGTVGEEILVRISPLVAREYVGG
ncbi:alanine racemase [Planococcus sp. APC 4015]|nr:alanine racemase [Planococcus sp. APC 4015]